MGRAPATWLLLFFYACNPLVNFEGNLEYSQKATLCFILIQTNISALFNDSFERCINDPLFLDQFYEIFISSSDEVRALFKNTEMETLKITLMTSLVYMSQNSNHSPNPLVPIAEKHSKNNRNIKPHFYVLWLDRLISAAKIIDPYFDENTEKLWKDNLQPGIDFMISKYDVDA